MQLPPWAKNIVFSLVVFVLVAVMHHAGLPMTQRIEEYIGFVVSTDYTHEELAEQAAVYSRWREGLTWGETVAAVSGQLRDLIGIGRDDVAPSNVPQPSAGFTGSEPDGSSNRPTTNDNLK